MLQKITKGIAEWLVRKEAISSDDAELYEFAVFNICMTLAPITLVMIIGALMHKIIEGLILITPFLSIRKYCGGFHASTPTACTISSTILLSILLFITDYISNPSKSFAILAISVISLVLHKPIDSENKILNDDEKSQYHKIAIKIIIFWCVLSIILIYLDYFHLCSCIVLGLTLAALLQLPCDLIKLTKRRGYP